MTPRPLWEAALEAQAQRVIEADPRDLPKCGLGTAIFASCRYCSAELSRTRINRSGVCAAHPCQSRKRKEFNSERKVWDAVREAVEARKRRMIGVASRDHTISREVLSERFGFHPDAISRMLADAGVKCEEPWWFHMRYGVATHRPAAKVGALPRNGNP